MHLCRWDTDKEKGLIGRDWIKRERISANWLSKNPIKSSSVVKYYRVYLRGQWILIGRPRGSVYRNYSYYSYIVVHRVYAAADTLMLRSFIIIVYPRLSPTIIYLDSGFFYLSIKTPVHRWPFSLLDRIVWGSENSTRIVMTMMLPWPLPSTIISLHMPSLPRPRPIP